MTTSEKKNYSLPIAMMFALFFMISFITGLQNPMGVIVKNQFEINNFLSQLGNFANFIAYLFMGIPAGVLLKRKGYKFTALAAIVVGFIGISTMILSGYIYDPIAKNDVFTFCVYITGAFISGFSMCMLNTVVNPMLNTLGGGGNKGNQLIQFGGTINSIGATIIPVLVGYLMGNVSQAQLGSARPALIIALGIFTVAFIVLSFVRIPEPHIIQKSAESKKKDQYGPMSFRHFILGTVAIFLYVGIEVGIPSIANLLMTQDGAGELRNGLGIEGTIAGSIVGTYWFLMLIGRLIGATLGGKVSSKAMLASVSLLGITFIVLSITLPLSNSVMMPVFRSDISFGMVQVPISIMFLILCGLCTSVMWGGIFNLAVEGLGKYTPAASGLFMLMVCGGGILPLIQAKVADLTNYMTSYWVIVAALFYLLFYALIGCKNVNKNIKTE